MAYDGGTCGLRVEWVKRERERGSEGMGGKGKKIGECRLPQLLGKLPLLLVLLLLLLPFLVQTSAIVVGLAP